MDMFFKTRVKGKHKGEILGFPTMFAPWCVKALKTNAVDRYIRGIDGEVTCYVGIAYDEPTRYANLIKRGRGKLKYSSPLYDLKITEEESYAICSKYNLLSPVYRERETVAGFVLNKLT